MRLSIVLVLALSLSACAVTPEEQASPDELPSLSGDQGRPLLALADHVLEGYFASLPGAGPTVCLATSDGREEVALAPAEERDLMMRHVRLSPLSACVETNGAWIDAETGDPALVFAVHTLSCPDAAHCTAFADYRAGDQQAAADRYDLAWQGENWTYTRLPGGKSGQ